MTVKITNAIVHNAIGKEKPYQIYGQYGLSLRVRPSGKRTFYLDVVRGGKRIQKKIGTAPGMTVARAEFKVREELNKYDDPDNPVWNAVKKATLAKFIDTEYSPSARRANKTLAELKRCFAHLEEYQLTSITSADLDSYVTSRTKDGRSPATIVRDLNSLRGVLRLAVERGYLKTNVFQGWRKPKVDDTGVTRYLNPNEEDRLRRALRKRDEEARRGRRRHNKWLVARGNDPLPEIPKDSFSDHLHPMVLISLNTGLRYGELSGLQWSAVDLRAKNLTVIGATSKGAKTRHIPMNSETCEVLTRWRNRSSDEGLIFTNPGGSRMGSVKTAWLKILKDANIENFRWHDMRHSFASKLVQRGVDLAVVRELLGHSDFKLTLRYAHLEPKQKADAVAKLMRR